MSDPQRFKIILLGDSSVGKTSIACKYAGQVRPKDHIPTIGASLFTSDVSCGDCFCSLEIWDTAGQDLYRALVPLYAHGASGALIVFDIASVPTFTHLDDWLRFLDDLSSDIFVVIFGNKSDLEDDRTISMADAISFASDKGMTYIEGSAKTGLHVDEAFELIAKGCIEREARRFAASRHEQSFSTETENSSGCC
jgi:small GTP-binding protein